MIDRFWKKVEICEPEHCWFWRASRLKGGYGIIGISGKNRLAHRVSYELHHGPIPEGMLVLHSCDNPSCVNPAHLHLGTQADNMREKAERGRASRLCGEKHGSSKLKEVEVRDIHLKHANGVSRKQLAEMFSVHVSVISKILNRKIWKHI